MFFPFGRFCSTLSGFFSDGEAVFNMVRLRGGLVSRYRFAKAWFGDGTPLWRWIAMSAILLGIPYVFPTGYLGVIVDLGDRVRWSGMLFQFAGLATVVRGLNKSRQLFDRS